ncbi:MAG TPA: dirigent protein [Solirubrobacteraceae bacterium]|nr:dirigent protein [Solirubrobacteraceae bacterium]
MKLKPSHLIAISAAGVAALSAGIAVPALTTAQTPAATVITVQEKVQTVVQDDVPPKAKRHSVSAGDRLITRQSLFNADERRIGTLYTDCTSVSATATFPRLTLLCTVTYKLGHEQIVAVGTARFNDDASELPIVGGTGAYAGARGTIKMTKPMKGYDSADVITING